MPTRVYIVEDHPVMRETLRDYLALSPDIELCGEAGDAETASGELEAAHPDIVVVDLSLPGRSGLELLEETPIRRRCSRGPEAGKNARQRKPLGRNNFRISSWSR